MSSAISLGSVPFEEAIEHYKNKKLVPTKHWDDMVRGEHRKAFTIAGATKVQMLNDFHKSLIDIRKRGGTITDFRKQFDDIVEQYGWSYKGKRGWRTKVIWESNFRTANAAGRYTQTMRRQAALKKRDPNATLYFEYRVLDHSLRRRPDHQNWHKIILPVDHSWWDTHYPPNGYGCACSIRVRTARYLKANNLEPTKSPPEIRRTERINTRSGEIYPATPEGIDVGWDHHHGKVTFFPNANNLVDDRLGHKIATLNAQSEQFEYLVNGSIAGKAVVGYLPKDLSEAMGSKTQQVYLSSDDISKQLDKHPEINLTDYRNLPEIFERGLVFKQKDRTIVIIHLGDNVYRAAVRVTTNGDELYLKSLVKTTDKEVEKLKRNYEVIREEI